MENDRHLGAGERRIGVEPSAAALKDAVANQGGECGLGVGVNLAAVAVGGQIAEVGGGEVLLALEDAE